MGDILGFLFLSVIYLFFGGIIYKFTSYLSLIILKIIHKIILKL
jgi:hypothetical protein